MALAQPQTEYQSGMDFRKTKIVCTLGPSTSSSSDLVKLIRAGMDAVRLNASHGSREDHLHFVRNARLASKETGKALAIIVDLQGGRIRIGKLRRRFLEVHQGKTLTLTTQDVIGDENRIPVLYRGLTRDLKAGHRILIDDGRIELKVVKVKHKEILCRIIRGGILKQHKGMNFPGVPMNVPMLTKKDKKDLKFALEEEVDYIALSFVQSARDVMVLKKILRRQKKDTPVIAKIERREAVEDLESIVRSADAIMVARGDLGVELAPEDVPMLQKRIVRLCNRHAKPVMIATQMLESMMGNPRPTRAEASDVANAVLDGADAVMLSGETAVGKFPVEATLIMDKIIRRAEEDGISHSDLSAAKEHENHQTLTAIGEGAALLAKKMSATAILTLTHTGATARVIARYRPSAKILAMTDQMKVICRLALVWGIRGIYLPRLADTDTTFEVVRRVALQSGEVKRGDFVIATAGIPLPKRGMTNMLKVERI